MTNINEYALTFSVENQQRLAIIHTGNENNNIGVLIVVGGPQYRVGSHRQFVQLSRSLAKSGITSMRFDYQGMGDSDGEKSTFDNICDDIKSAVDAFLQSQHHVKKVVIWGLCDAASAALIYGHQDPRVKGLVIVNPWMRSEQAMGKTMVKYYYFRRFLSSAFWKKLLTGKVNIAASAKDAQGFVKNSMSTGKDDESNYQARMLRGLQAFNGKTCLILSGNDLTAREFDEQTASNKAWVKLRCKENVIYRVAKADHTFSSSIFKQNVALATEKFVKAIK